MKEYQEPHRHVGLPKVSIPYTRRGSGWSPQMRKTIRWTIQRFADNQSKHAICGGGFSGEWG